MKPTTRKALLALLLVHFALPSQSAGQTSVGVAAGREQLSNDTPDWRESTLQVRHTFSRHHLLDLSLGETDRFGLGDTRVGAVYARPLADRLSATISAEWSPTHRVLAEQAVGGMLQYEFAPAWLVHAGGKTTGYDAVRVNQATLMLERYVSSFSWAAAWRPVRAYGTTVHGVDLRAAYYYGDANSVALTVAAGEEAAAIGDAVVLTDVRSIALTGRHFLNRSWSVAYAFGRTRQGDFYTRNGIHIGVQYAY